MERLIGGEPSIVIAGVVFAGLFGTIISEYIFKLFKIDEPIAKGLALGTSAHAIGTAEAVKHNEIEGAMASLAMVTSGIMMVGLVQLAVLLL